MTKKIIGFTTKQEPQETINVITDFSNKNNLNINDYISKTRINIEQKNPILDAIYNLSSNDMIIVHDALDLGFTTLEVTKVLSLLADQNISLVVVKYDKKFQPNKSLETKSILNLLQNIESEFEVIKQIDNAGRRRHSNIPLGRPKGRKNKELKLDKHKDDIKKYLDLKISKASISKLIGCHAQTLYNYIDKKEFEKS